MSNGNDRILLGFGAFVAAGVILNAAAAFKRVASAESAMNEKEGVAAEACHTKESAPAHAVHEVKIEGKTCFLTEEACAAHKASCKKPAAKPTP